MVTYIFRYLVALYFLFSAINKVFFFRLFARHLVEFFALSDGVLTAFAASVIFLEFIFAFSLILVDHRWWLRGLALIIAVPFIIYNAWIAFVLNGQSCHCTYGPSGESLTGPLFSIGVLVVTLVIVFWTTRKDKQDRDTGGIKSAPTLKIAGHGSGPFDGLRNILVPMSDYLRPLLIVIPALMMILINYSLWNAYNGNDHAQLRQIAFNALNSPENAPESDLMVYFNLPYGNPALTTHYLAANLKKTGTSASFYILSQLTPEQAELLSYLDIQTPIYAIDPATTLPDNLKHIGIQIYSDKTLLYRTDRLPEMTAEEYDNVFVELADHFSPPEECNNRETAKAYIDLIRAFVPLDEEYDLPLSVFLLMERQCEDCDSALLALLDGYFVETGVAEITKVYVLDELMTDDASDIIIPTTELKELTGPMICNYPNKLLLITDNAGRYAIVPAQQNLMVLELWITQFLDAAGIDID